ncbi:Calreticulin-domain-containing protein [Viridothelium virens]|uniref:Calreticulin-domain-containing protein n=1 Tax=Viridothelium virens TaxID=1048519 RepID=A0A6A6H8R7_VIRVR|nr:Calreticulin-domain-containing protein [Viridothelium virens]
MRFNAFVAALASSAALARADVADDAGEAVSSASSAASSAVESATSSSAIKKPTFTPASIKAPFLEQFTDDWESRWQASHAKKANTDDDWSYVGTWAVEEPSVLKGMEGDKGLVLKDKAAHHAISAKFPKAVNNKGKTLVVQYEVKLQNGLECGGAYMKLLQDNKALHAEEFSNASPYIIMFGPDKCGATNKVHFIFRHKNPKSGEYEEKHLKNPPLARITKTTSLYTLIVTPDQQYEIKIDGESLRNGSLLEDFSPAVNPDKEIDDPKDEKPSDWVEEAKIPDPDATKPDDWDEDAPYSIIDEEATKPDDWLDDEPTMIPDPEAEKPEDWDDEEDGDWVPPQVPNPKCSEVSGCGKWEPPTKMNPEYKGKWTAPLIDNPAYKGVWAPRKIANPDYFEDKTPANFEPMGAIGFELWTMQNDLLFDNIYIGHSLEDAEKLKAETYDLKIPVEKAQEEAEKPKPEDKPKSPLDLNFMDDPVTYVREKFDLFVTIARRDPIEAIRFVPEVAGGIGVLAVTVIALLVGALGAGSSAAPSKDQVKDAAQKAKDSAADTKDKVAESVSSGAEKVQSEVNKRTTRSQDKTSP